MNIISVTAFAEKYGISERTTRNYCANGKIEGAFLTGKTWNIPEDATMAEHQRLFAGYCLTAQDRFKAIIEYLRIK